MRLSTLNSDKMASFVGNRPAASVKIYIDIIISIAIKYLTNDV